jgi:hypothetical protein
VFNLLLLFKLFVDEAGVIALMFRFSIGLIKFLVDLLPNNLDVVEEIWPSVLYAGLINFVLHLYLILNSLLVKILRLIDRLIT